MKSPQQSHTKEEPYMYSVKLLHSKSNSKIKINFDGGDLSSDSGLLLIKEFAHKLGFHKLIKNIFRTNDKATRFHKDDQNLCQMIYQILAGYFNDNDADELSNEPIFKSILDKESLASQPTLSRFFNRMDSDTLIQFNEITKELRKIAYKIKKPEMVLFDLDSTLLNTFGAQEGEGFNFHYSANGYHPLLCYDGLTGDLLKAQLRDGTVYTSNGVVDFMKPLLDEYENNYLGASLYMRGDSGFAVPELFKQCETNSVSYAIRLKANQNLYKLSRYADNLLDEITAQNKVDYALVYDEFLYKAASWDYPRRVVVKVEKPANQFIYQHTFIVTNMRLSPIELFAFYCNRAIWRILLKSVKTVLISAQLVVKVK